HTRGDRLAFSNGILLLAGAAGLLVWIYGANSTRLIQLYIVGVFVSFTLSQTGMVRHWNRLLATERDRTARRHMMRSRVINAFGAFFTGLVLLVVLSTKFTRSEEHTSELQSRGNVVCRALLDTQRVDQRAHGPS